MRQDKEKRIIRDNKAFYAITHVFHLVRNPNSKDIAVWSKLLNGEFKAPEKADLINSIDHHYYQSYHERQQLLKKLLPQQKNIIESAITTGIYPDTFAKHVDSRLKEQEIQQENLAKETLHQLRKINQAFGLQQSILPDVAVIEEFNQSVRGKRYKKCKTDLTVEISKVNADFIFEKENEVRDPTWDIKTIINATDNLGNTLLHHACKKGNDSLIKFLLDNGASVDIKNMDDKTAFDLLKKPEILLSNHLDIQHDAVKKRNLPLLVAIYKAIKGDDELVNKFFENGNENQLAISEISEDNGSTMYHLLASDLVSDSRSQLALAKAMVDRAGGAHLGKAEVNAVVVQEGRKIDIEHLRATLLKKNSAEQFPIMVAMQLAKKKQEELRKAREFNCHIERAFQEVVSHLVDQLSKHDDEEYEILDNKLREINEAMDRLRRGCDKDQVLKEVLSNPIINETRNWYWPFKTKTYRLTKLAAGILAKNPSEQTANDSVKSNSTTTLHLNISKFDFDSVEASCNDFYLGYHQHDLGILLERDKKGLSPFELPLQTAIDFDQEKQKLLDRTQLIHEAFQLVTHYLLRQLAKHDKESGQYQKLSIKLKLVNSEINRLMTSDSCSCEDIAKAIDDLKEKKEIKAHRDLSFFRTPETVQRLEAVKARLSTLSIRPRF